MGIKVNWICVNTVTSRTMLSINLSFQKIGGELRPSLLILHGLFGSGRNWNSLAKKLSEQFCVYVLDLRNHGDSPHSDKMDYPHMAADVAAFMDREGLKRATVIGHSMGGKVAMWLALTQPEKVGKLIAVDIAPVHYNHGFSGILKGLKSIPLDAITSRKEADFYLENSVSEVSLRQFLLQNLKANNGQWCWRINLDVIERSISEILAFPPVDEIIPFTKQTLFIGGGLSDYILPEYLPTIEQCFPKAKVETIFDAGHWLHAEQPVKFLEIVNRFLLD